MKIWLLTSEYPPEYGGGIGTYCFHSAHMLAARGHQVCVFAVNEGEGGKRSLEQAEENLKVVRFRVNQTPQSGALGIYARMSYDLAEVLSEFIKKEGKPDLIESQEYLGLPYYLLQRRLLLEEAFQGIPVIVTAHTPHWICQKYDKQLSYRFPGYWVSEMERYSLLVADRIIYPSQRLLDEVEIEYPQLEERSIVIANPFQVNLDQVPLAGKEKREGFLFTAKIERRKGIEPLLSAFENLWEDGFNERLYLMGDDWYDELFQRNMSEYIQSEYGRFKDQGLLVWTGKQPPAAVKERLSQVRAMILPSLFENYPYAVLEAMSAGCPVIVSDTGGHAEIVEDEVEGFVFSHNEAGDLERKVKRLTALNREDYDEMSARAREKVQSLSGYQVVAPMKEKVYQDAIRDYQSGSLYPFLRGEFRVLEEENRSAFLFTKGLLSIVVPFYNLGETIEDTIASLFTISNLPFEVIVINDGSTDEASILKINQLREKYQFKLVNKKNEGVSAARVTGAEVAKGEFLAFLDADDCIDPAYYEQAIRILNHYENVHFVGCWAEYFGEAQDYWQTWTPEPPYVLVHNPINTSALVHRRETFLKYGKNDSSLSLMMEDYDVLLNLLENDIRGVSLPYPYFKYRVRSDSAYHVARENTRLYAYQNLDNRYAPMFAKYAEEIINILNANGPGFLYDNPTIWYPKAGFLTAEQDAENSPAGQNESLRGLIRNGIEIMAKIGGKLKREIFH